jgi:undecaprenyl-diphosphatase
MENFWAVVLLGLIEGITEFLPISSTGHLLIAEHWLGARSEMFNVVIQAGAVSAVVLIYWRRLGELCFQWALPENRDYLLKLAGAFGLTAILGLAFRKAGMEFPETPVPVAWAMVVGAVLIFIVEWGVREEGRTARITWAVVAAVGLSQVAAAVFPGLSRSGATIIAALALGLSRPAATEFSFLVGIPTMFAASGYDFWHEVRKPGALSEGALSELALGFVVSAVVAFIAVKWLLVFIRTHRFTSFAWYRLVAGAGLLIWWYGGGSSSLS